MSDNEIAHEIEPPNRLPGTTVTITPKQDGLTFEYRQIEGQDVIGILVDDHNVGIIELVMTPSLAVYAAGNIVEMVEHIDALREQLEGQQQ
jgi:hypothetical protein